MYIFFIILGVIYCIYCVSFICSLCYIIYKENREERRDILNTYTRCNSQRLPTILEVNGFEDSDEEN